MSRSSLSRRLLPAAAAVFGLTLVATQEAATDDRDLLRFNTAKPYVFLLLDTSGSMTQAPDGSWLPAGGDDPGSKIWQAKEALHEVFSNVDDIHLGFATFNQDRLRVRAKHWLYKVATGTESLAVGTATYPVAGELLTLGQHFEAGIPDVTAAGVAGECSSPLSLAAERQRINRFAKLGAAGAETTTIWLEAEGTVYRLTVSRVGTNALGSSLLTALLQLEPVPDCSSLPAVGSGQSAQVDLDFVRQFLMRDAETSGSEEPAAGLWEWEDALSDSACDTGGPFSGDGWEGNYDSIFDSGDDAFNDLLTNDDPFRFSNPDNACPDNASPSQCRNMKFSTTASSIARELDSGDMIPLHWNLDNLSTFLDRLAPNRNDGDALDFGAAYYLTDQPDSSGFLALKDDTRRPLIATGGDSPLGDAIADFRCWYRGQGANKCRDFGAPLGWENVAVNQDTEWGCRRPYLIVIGDGGDSCPGENPCADTANLRASAGIRSWVITFGGSAQPPLSCIASNGGGELVFVTDKTTLAEELNRVLGLVREEAAAFASAAAPSVQAATDRTIYVSTFVPLNNSSVWDGHLDSYEKPLPVDELTGEPLRTSEHFQWDAGARMLAQAPDQATADSGNLRIGAGKTQRRIFYSQLNATEGQTTPPGEWPGTRRAIAWTDDDTDASVRYDLWHGLGIPFLRDEEVDPADPTVDQAAQSRANQILSDTVAIKRRVLDEEEIELVLGDIFHSDPLVVGSPASIQLFVEDSQGDGTDCSVNPGYRCFFRKHQYRRKQLVVGSNDGMLHILDAGRPFRQINPETLLEEIRFDEGTGREVAAYIPRAVMPTVRQLAEGNVHRFSVDGRPVAADVFIDPAFVGSPDPDEREFRTVVVTGLREGGSAYFALDITQPDRYGALDGLPTPGGNASGATEEDDYVPTCLGPSPACGTLPYPAPLWEFDDSVYDSVAETYIKLDEDENGQPDLADTWAPVAIGRIQICEGGECDPDAESTDVRDMWVAVFGGGMDPDEKLFDPRSQQVDDDDVEQPFRLRGHYLYMVDIETGKAIYKRQLLVETPRGVMPAGSAPAGAAAVDTDQDGYLDRVYIPTLGGYLFRVDLGPNPDGTVPRLVDRAVPTLERDGAGRPVLQTVQRIPLSDSAGNALWEPRVIFDANFDGTTATAFPRPLPHEPSVVFVAQLGLYAVAVGSGDREDLWSGGGQSGRFYVFVDDTDLLAAGALPLTEDDLQPIGVNDADTGDDFLTNRSEGQRGWFLRLEPDERVITEAFALAGVTFFASYQPDIVVAEGRDPLCSKTGNSRIFVVNTTNANSFLVTPDDARSRYLGISNFVTQPYTEQGSNPEVIDEGGGGGEGEGSADELTPRLRQLMEEMKKLFPSECKFANYRIDIKTLSADTGVIFIAPVPVCIIEKNWREF